MSSLTLMLVTFPLEIPSFTSLFSVTCHCSGDLDAKSNIMHLQVDKRKRELADHLHGVSRRGLAAEEFRGGKRPVPVHVLPVRPVAPVLCPVGKI